MPHFEIAECEDYDERQMGRLKIAAAQDESDILRKLHE
jgi:hypothetical protein